ncbi:MAG TPA: hypothetical protein VMH26_06580 [Burkholderiales bacterium]|nr:hypothetical protein [Burkholderiales bacterium]
MFNSPLQYCPKCKQYVELDQTMKECAASHDCGGRDCPLVEVFSPPASSDETQPTTPVAPKTGVERQKS